MIAFPIFAVLLQLAASDQAEQTCNAQPTISKYAVEFPRFDIENIDYLLFAASFINYLFATSKMMQLKDKFKKGELSYFCLVVALYWEVHMAAIICIILQSGQQIFQTIGLQLLLIIINHVCWTLNSVGKGSASLFEQAAAFLFQAVIIISAVIEPYLFFRITYIAYVIFQIIRYLYLKVQKKSAVWDSLANVYSYNLFFKSISTLPFSGVKMDPFSVHYAAQCICFGGLTNLYLYNKLVVNAVKFVKQYVGLSILKRIHKWQGRQLANQTCIICLSEMDAYQVVESGESYYSIQHSMPNSLVKTSCNHVFHAKCVQLWVRERWSCPIDSTFIPVGSLMID